MAKLWGQNIPPAIYDWYTRILGVQRSTGFNYWEKYYGYGYGGLVGKRIPFRMRRWQNKYGKKISPKRLTQRSHFQKATWVWHNQEYSYGVPWGQVGPVAKTTWSQMAFGSAWQYFRYFMYYSIVGIQRGEILNWQKLETFRNYVFDDAYFA